MAQAVDISKTLQVGIVDIVTSVVLATAIDNAVPAATQLDAKPIWQIALEAGGQTLVNVLLLMELRNHLPGVYSDDPTNGFIPNGILFTLQPNLLHKYRYLCKALAQYAGSIFQPATDPAPPQPTQ